jgi:hypothetical protein
MPRSKFELTGLQPFDALLPSERGPELRFVHCSADMNAARLHNQASAASSCVRSESSANLRPGMLRNWSRAFVFIALAALVANAHCFGNCVSETCRSTKAPSNSCHHQKPSHQDAARCSHQHSEFAAPESIGKVNVETAAAAFTLPAACDGTVLLEPVFVAQGTAVSPPGRLFSSPISVLRI